MLLISVEKAIIIEPPASTSRTPTGPRNQVGNHRPKAMLEILRAAM